jgi:hypothetical protein
MPATLTAEIAPLRLARLPGAAGVKSSVDTGSRAEEPSPSGDEIDTQGDSFFVAFRSASDAVASTEKRKAPFAAPFA